MLEGGGGHARVNKCRQGEGVVGRLLGKKIIAIIFVKFTQIIWQYVCIFFFLILILEHLHFCLANHACVSHLLHGQPHL